MIPEARANIAWALLDNADKRKRAARKFLAARAACQKQMLMIVRLQLAKEPLLLSLKSRGSLTD